MAISGCSASKADVGSVSVQGRATVRGPQIISQSAQHYVSKVCVSERSIHTNNIGKVLQPIST